MSFINSSSKHSKMKILPVSFTTVTLLITVLQVSCGVLTSAASVSNDTSGETSAPNETELNLDSLDSDETFMEQRRLFIREMVRGAWKVYANSSWGHDMVQPVSGKMMNHNFGPNSGFTLVTTMDTLWVMNLTEEYDRAYQWVKDEMDFGLIDWPVNVYRAVTDYMGALLSCFALTGEKVLLDKAKHVADVLEVAFKRRALPYPQFDPMTQTVNESNQYLTLTEAGDQQVELVYLANQTDNNKISARVERMRHRLNVQSRVVDLLLGDMHNHELFVGNGQTPEGHDKRPRFVTLAEDAGNYYYTLLRSYLQTGNTASLEWYEKQMDLAKKNGLFGTSRTSGLFYARDRMYDKDGYAGALGEHMDYTSCYLGAMLSQGAQALERELKLKSDTNETENGAQAEMEKKIRSHRLMADRLTETCTRAAEKTATKLAPRKFYFDSYNDASSSYRRDHTSMEFQLGNSQLAESYFILWRLTKKPKYRDYAWEMVKAISTNCRTENDAYSNLRNVEVSDARKQDFADPRFLSATLKYLYLTFTNDSVLPLDSWFFNSAGHPLPVLK